MAKNCILLEQDYPHPSEGWKVSTLFLLEDTLKVEAGRGRSKRGALVVDEGHLFGLLPHQLKRILRNLNQQPVPA